MSIGKRWIAVLTALMLVLCSMSMAVGADGSTGPEVQATEAVPSGQPVEIHAKSAVLMEVSTGKVLYEMNSHEKRAPASITKVMTALLTMEAVESGRISLDDMVLVSEHAQSLGGTTIFLEAGGQMSGNDMLKGMMVNSANDAAVALGEHIAGSEEAFVAMMNQRAQELGMTDTHFVNCHGLDAEGHETTAHDIGIMSVELLRHEKIMDYTTIWTDSLRNGATGLANTNRLIRFYEYATGLKTGTTNHAGRCVSASARKDGLHLVAVVLGGEQKNDQFNGARNLLEWGFANYSLVEPPIEQDLLKPVKVLHGVEAQVELENDSIGKVLLEKGKEGQLQCAVDLAEDVEAPVEKGQVLGKIVITADGETITEIPLKASKAVEKLSFGKAFELLIQEILSL